MLWKRVSQLGMTSNGNAKGTSLRACSSSIIMMLGTLERKIETMATFNYVLGRTEAYRSVECGIDIPSLWTATVISGMPEGKTMNSGSAATAKEAVNALVYKMKQAGYSGSLYLVDDATVQRKSKPVVPMLPVKKRKT